MINNANMQFPQVGIPYAEYFLGLAPPFRRLWQGVHNPCKSLSEI